MPFEVLQDELDTRAAQGLLRHRYELQSAQGTRVKVNGEIGRAHV